MACNHNIVATAAFMRTKTSTFSKSIFVPYFHNSSIELVQFYKLKSFISIITSNCFFLKVEIKKGNIGEFIHFSEKLTISLLNMKHFGIQERITVYK